MNLHVQGWAQVYAPRLRERTKMLEQWVKGAGEAEWIKDEIIWFSRAMLVTLDMFDKALREARGESSAVPSPRPEPARAPTTLVTGERDSWKRGQDEHVITNKPETQNLQRFAEYPR